MARGPSLDRRQITTCTSKKSLTPRLLLCDISNVTDQSFPWLRVYKLPDTWSTLSSIDIRPNLSPSRETNMASGTYFYPDPCSRIAVISIDLGPNSIPSGHSKHVILVLEESFLRPAGHNEPAVLSWSQWGQQCLVRYISDDAYSFSVIGRRLIYLETVEDKMSPRSRLRTVEFYPRSAGYTQSNHGAQQARARSGRGTVSGSCSQPGKPFPQVGSNSMDVQNATMFGATEDNLVIFHVRSYHYFAVTCLTSVKEDQETLVRILTFGKSTLERDLKSADLYL